MFTTKWKIYYVHKLRLLANDKIYQKNNNLISAEMRLLKKVKFYISQIRLLSVWKWLLSKRRLTVTFAKKFTKKKDFFGNQSGPSDATNYYFKSRINSWFFSKCRIVAQPCATIKTMDLPTYISVPMYDRYLNIFLE